MKLKLLLSVFMLSSATFAQTIELEQVATGFASISEIARDGSNSNKLYVVQQGGQIRILQEDGTVNTTPFVTVSPIRTGGEQGLLGLAFHPEYATNGYFYVYYVNNSGDIEIARYTRSTTNPEVADATSRSVVLTIPHPVNSNHNGGSMHFGADGYLYISTGDGGGGGDQSNNAQNTGVLLGKMLRIDINIGNMTDVTYLIPPTNPFAIAGGAQEVWAYGLRNAWKFSYDRLNGDMWIADVGQNAIEEINKVTTATAGRNFGWRCYEGNSVYNNNGCPSSGTLTFPVVQYNHSGSRCSITGGYVYSGTEFANMQNKYFFADYCSGSIGWVNSTIPDEITWTPTFNVNFTTFGEDNSGNLYIAGGDTGIIYKVTDATAGTAQFDKKEIKVHPNPASNEVFVTFKGEDATATIYDLGGKRLLQEQLTTQANRIDTSALQTGIYMMEVTVGSNRTQQKLVIN
ncbi:T9SS type A sorting domain-containing protein [Flavobacterium sp. Sd200]|uniref:PQQ-dependent sugar dehydrogenase n=1 Tax=Flavobacterium sp. Sd200 TaxID=2692211 RepID=UPI00136A3C5F|nr:PQQ-dependent sugar dehydrogenase [Flavobacterium sp. Sd200]MXN92764.1 T9SS type A sorting domain-containing protein [Flavobacterium sp. Sd200]